MVNIQFVNQPGCIGIRQVFRQAAKGNRINTAPAIHRSDLHFEMRATDHPFLFNYKTAFEQRFREVLTPRAQSTK